MGTGTDEGGGAWMRYIAFVKAGERVLITKHDKVVAEIIPSIGQQAP